MSRFTWDRESGLFVPKERRIEPIRNKRLCSLGNMPGPSIWGSSVATDPYYANVTFLCHCESATPWVDDGPTHRTITPSAGAAITPPGIVLRGLQSYYADSVGDCITVTSANSQANQWVYSGEFTIEFLITFDTINATQRIIWDHGIGGSAFAAINFQNPSVGTTGFYGNVSTGYFCSGGATPYVANTPYFIAVTRNAANLVTIWRGQPGGNATSYVSATEGSTYSGSQLNIGSYGSGGLGNNGSMDEMRITKGVCRYTGTFAVPTGEFPNS